VVIVPVYWTRMIMYLCVRIFGFRTGRYHCRVVSARCWSAVNNYNDNNNNSHNTYIIIILYGSSGDVEQVSFMRQRSPKTSHQPRTFCRRWSIRQGVHRLPSNYTRLLKRNVTVRKMTSGLEPDSVIITYDNLIWSLFRTKTGSRLKSVIFTIVSFWILYIG